MNKTRVLKRAKIAQNMQISDWYRVHEHDDGMTAHLGAVIGYNGHLCAMIRYSSKTYAIPVANLLASLLLNQMT